jgi:hypothetical protein
MRRRDTDPGMLVIDAFNLYGNDSWSTQALSSLLDVAYMK